MKDLLKHLEWALETSEKHYNINDSSTPHEISMAFAYKYGVVKTALKNAIREIEEFNKKNKL